MTARSQVFGRPLAFAALLFVLACQRESGTDFDDSHLPGTGAAMSGGAPAKAGDGPGAAPSTGGTDVVGDGGSAAGGEGEVGGTAAAGGGGKAGAATAGEGGKAGAAAGGSGSAGASMAGGGSGGTGGKPPDPDPDPVTISITDIDDAHVVSCAAYMNYGNTEKLMVDGNFGCTYATLIDPALEKIPSGAAITAASLELSCTNAGGPITVSFVDETWTENAVRYNARPEVGEKIGALTCEAAGRVEIDVLAAVKAWLDGEHEAFGVYLQTTSQDGTDFVSSEADDAATRPALVVTYEPKP